MEKVDQELIQFSFGENWRSFVRSVTEEAIELARKDIEEWVGETLIRGMDRHFNRPFPPRKPYPPARSTGRRATCPP